MMCVLRLNLLKIQNIAVRKIHLLHVPTFF